MKRLIWIPLWAALGCASHKGSTPGAQTPADYMQTDPRLAHEEVGSLPFRSLEWDYKLRDRRIRRMTLGSEHIYCETHDNHIVAIHRFTGKSSWEYVIPTDNPPDWAPVEADGVGAEILSYEKELRNTQAIIEAESKKQPVDDALVQSLTKLRKKRAEWYEKIQGASVNDNVYFLARNWLHCLDRRTGRDQWRVKLDFVASAQLYATRVYAFIPGLEHSRIHVLRVAERAKQALEFRIPLERHNQIFERPVFFHPLLYVAERNGTMHAYWVDKETEHFRFQIQYPIMAEPYVHRRMRTTEKVRVENPKEGQPAIQNVQRVYDILCFGGLDKCFYALDAGGGNLLWKYHLPSVIKEAATGRGETIYVKTEDGYLHAFEAMPKHVDKDGVDKGVWSLGRLRWQLPKAERFVLKTGTGVYVMGEGNDKLIKLEETTGKIIGQYPLANLKIVMTNLQDDLLYVATTDGHIFCLQEWRDEDLFKANDRAAIMEKTR